MFDFLFKRGNEEINLLDIIGKNMSKMQMAGLAQEKAASMIAKAIAKSEIVLTKKGERRRDAEYFRLNVRPNDNETGTDFWYQVTKEMLQTGECVVCRLPNGKYYRAASWTVDNYVLYSKTYNNIVLTDGRDQVQLRYGISADDVMHFRFGSPKLRTYAESVLDMYNDVISAMQAMGIATNTPLFKYKVDANMSFRRKEQDGKEVRMTIDQVIDEMIDKITENGIAIIKEPSGTTLEAMDMKAKITASELDGMAALINKQCAEAYDIPLAVYNGAITENSDATNEFITFAVAPPAEVINDTMNAKLVGEIDYVGGERAQVHLARFKHIDVVDSAANLNYLRGIGFTLDEIFEMIGYPELGTEFSQARALTKNYATEGEEEGTTSTSAEDHAEESGNRTQKAKHKERRKRRYGE